MRVALLEIDLDRDSRSGNLQRIIAAIHQAVQRRPAPDLLVLPAACDTGGVVAARSSEPRELALVAEAISWEARDWGLYIVCGLHAGGDDGWRGCTVLFDADGDTIASTAYPSGGDADSSLKGVAVWQCPHGRIVLGESVAAIRLVSPTVVKDAFVAVPLPLTLKGRAKASEWDAVASLVRKDADRSEAYWGLVGAVGAESPGATCVLGPSGSPLWEVERGGDDAIVVVDVSIDPKLRARASGASGATGRADQAD